MYLNVSMSSSMVQVRSAPISLHLSLLRPRLRSVRGRSDSTRKLDWRCRCCIGDSSESTAPPAANEDSSFWQCNTERYHPALSKEEKNEKRAESQRLGKKLCLLIVGRAGITRNTVISLGDALAKNELVKVCVNC